ncbi:hypothetical protein ACP70R_041983 [Stipagrostis hirtigluma subsp. patula]
MAARALAAVAGRRVAGYPLVIASGRGGGARNNPSRGVHAQAEEERSAGDHGAVAAAVTAEQVEAALNSKNVEEVPLTDERSASVLPDEVVDDADAAWVPDEETGVFVPAEEAAASADGGPHEHAGSSVLDQTVFVREEEMEDVERPAVDMDNDAGGGGDAK